MYFTPLKKFSEKLSCHEYILYWNYTEYHYYYYVLFILHFLQAQNNLGIYFILQQRHIFFLQFVNTFISKRLFCLYILSIDFFQFFNFFLK